MTLTWNQYTHLIMYRLLISYKDLLLIGLHRVKNRMTDVSPFNVIAGNYKIQYGMPTTEPIVLLTSKSMPLVNTNKNMFPEI